MTRVTGKQVLEQVREALLGVERMGVRNIAGWPPKRPSEYAAALDGCVLLTAEEAERRDELVRSAVVHAIDGQKAKAVRLRDAALLTPTDSDGGGYAVTEQTGKQVKEQVREALLAPYSAMGEENCREALAALDGCVVLTAEQAETLYFWLRDRVGLTKAEADAWLGFIYDDLLSYDPGDDEVSKS